MHHWLLSAAFKKPTTGRLLSLITLAAVLSASPTSRAADAIGEAEGIRRICTVGPQSAAARAERVRGTAGVRAAAVLPNPALVVEHQRTLDGATDHETVIGAAVPLGLGGTRALLRGAAEARDERALWHANATLFDLALAFREAYHRAAFDALELEVLNRQQAQIDALGVIIRRLSEHGEAAGYDLSRQEVQSKLHLSVLESTRARAQGTLAFLEGWVGARVLLSTSELRAFRGGVSTRGLPAEAIAAQHPRVRTFQAEARASALAARAARRRWVPDVELFAGYRTSTVGSETGRGISLAATVPLTFFDHGQGEAALADAERQLALATADGLRSEWQARLRAEKIRLRALESSAANVERASSEAVAVQGHAIKLYEAGEVTLAELFDTFRVAEEAQLRHIEAAEEIAEVRLSLMRLSGTLFDPMLDRACRAGAGAER